jgi:hypothetical protein
MADEQDLVSQIKITGGGESASEIEAFANKGSAAFDKLAGAAKKADDSISKSAADIAAKSKTAAAGLQTNLGKVNLTDFHRSLDNVKDKLDNLTASFPPLIQAAGRFAQRITIVGASAVAAGLGIAKVATNVVKALDGQSSAAEDLTKKQIDANNAQLDGQLAQINYESSLRQLNKQLATGQISYLDYSAAVRKLNEDFKEQRRVAGEVAAAQAIVKEENDRLTKQLADRKAYTDLIDTFGGPLVTAFSALGRAVSGIQRQFINAFGPAAAKLIDLITSTLNRNAGAISNFFDVAAAKLTDLLDKHGPEIVQMMETIGAAVGKVFLGILDAAPGIILFFNNKLVPAIQKVAGIFQGAADAINGIFGTNISAGGLVLITLFAQMTGSIKILFALLRSGGAIFKGLISLGGALAEGLGLLFGGGKVTTGIIKFTTAVAKAGGPVSTLFAVLKNGVPLIILFAEILGGALGVGLGIALPLVIALGAALIYLMTKVDWTAFAKAAGTALTSLWNWLKMTWENAKLTAAGIQGAWQMLVTWFAGIGAAIGGFFSGLWAGILALGTAAVEGVKSAWTAVVDFFSALIDSIGQFFSDLWDEIVAEVTTAITAVQTAWTAVVAWFQTAIIAPIVAFFTAFWAGFVKGWTDIVDGIKTAWTAVVDFFSGIATSIQGVFQSVLDTIVGYWNGGIEKIKGFFSSLYASAMTYLQPIIDMLKKIISLGSSEDTATGGAQGYATGGPISGPGTGTSDSVPIWASNGEFMMKARAVAKYGRSFMDSINSGNFRMPGFADGGLIGAMSPAASYALDNGGGNTPALSPLNLTLFGEQFKGLMMPEDVGRRLTKFAIEKQTTSAGRKPAWVGGGRK